MNQPFFGTLNVVQYNVGTSKDKIQSPFTQQLDPFEHHIIAIQEPYVTKKQTTIKTNGYHTCMDGFGENIPKTAIYVSMRLPRSSWSVQHHSPYIQTITLRAAGGDVAIHNIYLPGKNKRDVTRDALSQLSGIIQSSLNTSRHIVLGDTNLHHKEWMGREPLQPEQQGEALLSMMTNFGLTQRLQPGTTT